MCAHLTACQRLANELLCLWQFWHYGHYVPPNHTNSAQSGTKHSVVFSLHGEISDWQPWPSCGRGCFVCNRFTIIRCSQVNKFSLNRKNESTVRSLMRNIWAAQQAWYSCGNLFSILRIISTNLWLVIQINAFGDNVSAYILQMRYTYFFLAFLYFKYSTFCTHQGLGKFTLLPIVSPELLWSAPFNLIW